MPLPPDDVEAKFYFTDSTNDAVYSCEDLNCDGDAQDLGEIAVYYDDSSPNIDLGNPRGLAFGPDGALYVIDSTVNGMNVYAYDFKSGALGISDQVDLGVLRERVRQATPIRRPNRR